MSMKQLIKSALARGGLELTSAADRRESALADLAPADRELVARVEPFTMTSLDRRAACSARSTTSRATGSPATSSSAASGAAAA